MSNTICFASAVPESMSLTAHQALFSSQSGGEKKRLFPALTTKATMLS